MDYYSNDYSQCTMQVASPLSLWVHALDSKKFRSGYSEVLYKLFTWALKIKNLLVLCSSQAVGLFFALG